MKENLYTPNKIRVASGIYIDPFAAKPEDITLYDILTGLSRTCRFAGHTNCLYTVLHHSLLVCDFVDPEHRIQALLHDASEAYIGDIPGPVKNRLAGYQELEDSLMTVIGEKYGFDWPMHEDVVKADKMALELEWHQFVIGKSQFTPLGIVSLENAWWEMCDELGLLTKNAEERP